MTDDNKHDDKDRKKVSDEKMEDVAGGVFVKLGDIKGNVVKRDKKRADSGSVDHNSSRSNNG